MPGLERQGKSVELELRLDCRAHTNHAEHPASLQDTHHTNHQLHTPRRIHHHHLSSLQPRLLQRMPKDVGRLIDLLIRECRPLRARPRLIQRRDSRDGGCEVDLSRSGLYDAGFVRVSSGVPGEDVGDGTLEAAPVEVLLGVREGAGRWVGAEGELGHGGFGGVGGGDEDLLEGSEEEFDPVGGEEEGVIGESDG